MRKHLVWGLPVLVFLLPLALYIRTLAATYIPIDSAEFTLCMYSWGVCHPPGFPFYVFVGHIFLKILPLGTVVWRANFFSAIFGALAVTVVFLILRKLKVDELTSVLLALLLAVSSTFWEFSLSADVFTFGSFLTSLAFYLAISKRKYLAFFVLGLSASHFYITGALWPLFWWFLGSDKETKSERVKGFIVYGFIFAMGFFPQAIMFLRMQQNPVINWGHADGILGFVDFIRRKEFGSAFLISNPVLTYSPVKNFWQIVYYFRDLLFEFGLVLPVSVLLFFFLKPREDLKKFLFLLYSFLLLVFVQLFLLSTIDPTDPANPFQINKFYIYSFLLVIPMAGLVLKHLKESFFEENFVMIQFFLAAISAIYLLVNFRTHDMSRNYFSQNLISDMYSQLPKGSVAVTLDHLVYFAGRYEQVVNGKFGDITIIYFPNEHNQDYRLYHMELYNEAENQDFINRVKNGRDLGGSEAIILSLISKNLDRGVFLANGDFENNFFRYLDGESEPYGLWAHVKNGKDLNADQLQLNSNYLNNNIKRSDFGLYQQASETAIYSVSYYKTGLFLARAGDFDGAIDFFGRSLRVNDVGVNVGNDLDLVKKVKRLSEDFDKLVRDKDLSGLDDLGQGLFTIGNYGESAKVYDAILGFVNGDAKIYNNAASSYANIGNVSKAREYYNKALSLDPNLQVAKDGLGKLDDR